MIIGACPQLKMMSLKTPSFMSCTLIVSQTSKQHNFAATKTFDNAVVFVPIIVIIHVVINFVLIATVDFFY